MVIYFKILPDSLNEATMKQQMTSISDYIIVCLFQNYKNMRNKRTGAKGKRLSKEVFSKTWFYNNVKRMTHIFEGMFMDPFDNDNLSDHPLNFVSGVNQGKST